MHFSNGSIKTQLAKFVETLQIPWLKALLLVLLNLRSTPFGTHRLSFLLPGEGTSSLGKDASDTSRKTLQPQ